MKSHICYSCMPKLLEELPVSPDLSQGTPEGVAIVHHGQRLPGKARQTILRRSKITLGTQDGQLRMLAKEEHIQRGNDLVRADYCSYLNLGIPALLEGAILAQVVNGPAYL